MHLLISQEYELPYISQVMWGHDRTNFNNNMKKIIKGQVEHLNQLSSNIFLNWIYKTCSNELDFFCQTLHNTNAWNYKTTPVQTTLLDVFISCNKFKIIHTRYAAATETMFCMKLSRRQYDILSAVV